MSQFNITFAPLPAWLVALTLNVVRIVMGYMWWTQAQWKTPPDWGCGEARDRGLCDWIQREVDSPLIPQYRDFLVNIVQPNLSWMGGIIWATEVFIALALFFGVFNRLGALVATGMSINLLIGLWNVPHEWYWAYIFMILISLALYVTNAGRPFGIDQLIQPRLQPSLPPALRWLV